MSAGPDPQVDSQVIEQERRRLSRRLDEVARMCEANIPPTTFYGEMLKRLLESLAAPAGAVWARTSQGNLQMQFQINLKEVGLDHSEEARQAHEELLRQVVMQPRPIHLLPHSGVGTAEAGKVAAGNQTGHLLLLVPIILNEQVSGLIEVWQNPHRPLQAVPGFLQFMTLMAELATRYQRNQMLGQMTGQQALWTQLEAFARQIHGSLNPTEVAYLIANEGRRLVECDRVTVAVRRSKRTTIEAVSGADIVEKRSNLVVLMRKLCDEVITWGEKLVFTGTKDDSLPPKVLEALDGYLAESSSKLLVVQPLHDEREGDPKSKAPVKPARSAVLMECFEPPAEPQQLVARLDVVGKHATTALYNAIEHRRIPMRFLWLPLARLQDGLGGKGRAISALVVVALTLLVSVLVLVPYPLKMDATGQLVPVVRRNVAPKADGKVRSFSVKPAEDEIKPDRVLAELDDAQLQVKLQQLKAERETAARMAQAYEQQLRSGNILDPKLRFESESAAAKMRITRDAKEQEILDLVRDTGAVLNRPGLFLLRAPRFTSKEEEILNRREWTVLSGNFSEEWTGRMATPKDPVLRLGAKEGPWEIELKIPQKHIGQILNAFEKTKQRGQYKDLDVDFLLRSDPTRTFKGKLSRDKIAGEANPTRDDNNEQEPVVLAYVRIVGSDIPAADRLPRTLLLSGTEVHAKVRCGDHAMGYSLFYGVWEFLYEKVVFFF